jgi:predicted phage tail protein
MGLATNGKEMTMSLSEEERQILHQMEQSLRRHDRAVVDRVLNAKMLTSKKTARWAVAAFVAGFALLLVAFGASVLLGGLGFVIMLCSSLVLLRHFRQRATGGANARRARDA